MAHDALKYPGDVKAESRDEATGKPTTVTEAKVVKDPEPIQQPGHPPRIHKRKSLDIDRDEVVKHLIKNYDADLQERIDWSEVRVQRYAKLRGWLEVKNYPWPNAANTHIPDLMTDSLRTQDTLHNAVLAVRPVMSAKALKPEYASKGQTIDQLLDYQLFVEQKGEEKIGEIIQSFVEDGTFVAYIPWIRDNQRVVDVRILPAVPKDSDEAATKSFVIEQLTRLYPRNPRFEPKGDYHWTITAEDDEGRDVEYDVKVYEDETDRLQVVSEGTIRIYEGPCVIPKPLEDVVLPARCENLQPPSPSNPGGAPHVFMVDYPTRDEILRLYKSGYYDLMSEEDAAVMETAKESKLGMAQDPEAIKAEKDALAGQIYGKSETAKEYFTRLICFDRWDVNGDGLEEDVIFWFIKEPKILCKVKYMTELFPSNPPRRPFAEGRFLPVKGEFYGIGLLELMEHVHDLIKVVFDQMIDNGTLANTPFGFYRATSAMRPETVRFAPGELYPTSNPADDISFPQMPNANQAWALNLVTMLGQMEERLTMVGELQLGRVPYGKASALRTTGGMNNVLQQGDARPERILRRFFRGLSEVYQQMHELNQAFLPPKKGYRIFGMTDAGKDPYKVIDDPSQIRGSFSFDFQANVLNTNKAQHAQTMQQILATLVNGMTMQMGLVDKDKAYRMFKEWLKALGEDPNNYLNKPSADADLPLITAEEAINSCYEGNAPEGKPAEGLQAHTQLVSAFQNDPKFALFNDYSRMIYQDYVTNLKKELFKQQQMAEQMNQFAGMMNGAASAGGQQQQGPPDQSMPTVSPNELMNETLPSAGGGAK